MEQINNLTLEQTFFVIIRRLINIPEDLEGSFYEIDSDLSKDFYDRINLHESLAKPSFSDMEQELELYKEELRVLEQARLDEIARVDDIKNRWNAIPDVRGAISKASLNISNPLIELTRIIEANDVVTLSLLETSSVEFQQELAQIKERDRKKEIGRKNRILCDEVLFLISGHIQETGASESEKDELEVRFFPIQDALIKARSDKAISLIENVQEEEFEILKQEILKEFARI